MFSAAFMEGLIWSVMWIVFVYVIIHFFPWELVHDYPKDVQEQTTLPDPTKEQQKHAKLFSILASLIIFGTVILFVLLRFRSIPTGFLDIFLYILIIVMTWNVVDLLLMDWIIVCTITPKWIVLPGTDGCAGYKDYLFHFKGFLIGCVYSTISAFIVAGISFGILHFFMW